MHKTEYKVGAMKITIQHTFPSTSSFLPYCLSSQKCWGWFSDRIVSKCLVVSFNGENWLTREVIRSFGLTGRKCDPFRKTVLDTQLFLIVYLDAEKYNLKILAKSWLFSMNIINESNFIKCSLNRYIISIYIDMNNAIIRSPYLVVLCTFGKRRTWICRLSSAVDISCTKYACPCYWSIYILNIKFMSVSKS